jgi:hypothetical protein
MKNVILIIALAISTAAFSQMSADAFENVKPDLDIIYKVTHVSYSVKDLDTDLYGEFESGEVTDMVSQDVVFNQNLACFLFPTINSGLIPVMAHEFISEEILDSGLTLRKYSAEYKFQNKIIECDLYTSDRDDNRSVLYFATEQIVIVYEVERVGIQPNQRTY